MKKQCCKCSFSELHFFKKSTCTLSKCNYDEFKKSNPVILQPGRMLYLSIKVILYILLYFIFLPIMIVFGSVIIFIVAFITCDGYNDFKDSLKHAYSDLFIYIAHPIQILKSIIKDSLD